MEKAIISVKDLVKKYGSFEAVKGISFDVNEGEIFGLLGPNGAGKSTTLEIIETLREKTSGEITVAGFDLDRQPNEIKKIEIKRKPSTTIIDTSTAQLIVINHLPRKKKWKRNEINSHKPGLKIN